MSLPFALCSTLSGVLFLELLGNGPEVVRRIDFIAKGSPRFLLHVPIQAAQGIRLNQQLDDETEGHGHHPRDEFATFWWKITIKPGLLRVGHDLLKGLGLIVPQENRDKNSLIDAISLSSSLFSRSLKNAF
jgi:hypothetical protein